MNLIDAIGSLHDLNDESTIYAAEPWTEVSRVIIAPQPLSGIAPVVSEGREHKYFLEVFVAKEFLDDWIGSLEVKPTIKEQCARLIQYAITDA